MPTRQRPVVHTLAASGIRPDGIFVPNDSRRHSSMAHAITLTSTLGDSLLFANMTAKEQLGRLFSYELETISKNIQIDLRTLLGTPMTVKLVTPQGYTRYFNGIVCEG